MSFEEVVHRWLTKEYDYERPHRGQVRQGEILKIEEHGVTVDLGLKRDGFVPRADLERLGAEAASGLEPGQEVKARITRLEDQEGLLLLSMYQVRFEKDWENARELLESGDVWWGEVIDCNRGGLIVSFGHLRAFVPGSHLVRRLDSHERKEDLEAYLGEELPLKVIEVDQSRRRLIVSERFASRQLREENMERLLDELVEGEVCRGTVSGLRKFGAFVDLGGAEGLIHISELAWRRIRDPREVLQLGDEIDVYVLRLDHQRKRIGLSLKRLQPNPWSLVDQTYALDQLVLGTVTNVVDYGAFVALGIGVEGLVHVSQLADPQPSNPREVVKRGDELVLRILRIDTFQERIALSLKGIDDREREEWLARRTDGESGQADESGDTPADGREPQSSVLNLVEEIDQGDSVQVGEERLNEVATPTSAGQTQEEGLWVSLLQKVEAKDA